MNKIEFSKEQLIHAIETYLNEHEFKRTFVVDDYELVKDTQSVYNETTKLRFIIHESPIDGKALGFTERIK